MIHLSGSCYCSDITVHPQNWNTKKASLKAKWYLQYRFYDRSIKDGPHARGKLCIIKEGINTLATLEERQFAVRHLLQREWNILRGGFNPITDRVTGPIALVVGAPSDKSPLMAGLNRALQNLSCASSTRTDIRSTLKYVGRAATDLLIDTLPLEEVRRKHIKAILARCEQIKDRWSNNTFNAYRKNLHILFEQLIEEEAMDLNPCDGIKLKKVVSQPRKVLTPEQCRQVDAFTLKYDRRMWRLIHIFFHSGSRTTELLRVQGKHVDLKTQTVQYLVLKGRKYDWVERPIKDIALPLWQELMTDCGPEDYLFSKGLEPGEKPIRPDQIKRRWARHIQGKKIGKKGKVPEGKLNITCTWYSLKHLNTTQVVDALDEQAAANLNGHSDSTMVAKVYDINNRRRKQDQVRALNNKFGG